MGIGQTLTEQKRLNLNANKNETQKFTAFKLTILRNKEDCLLINITFASK